MIKEVKVQQGWSWVTAYEYRLHAFRTQKGTFTLTGTTTETIDTFKNLDTGEFHDWPRQSIKKWLDQGKISPIPESSSLTWYQNQCRPSKGRAQSKVIRK